MTDRTRLALRIELGPQGGCLLDDAARDLRARSAAGELTRVDFARSILVPRNESCFSVVDAPSRVEAALVAWRARLDPVTS